MQLSLLALSTIFFLNSCKDDPKPCSPVPCTEQKCSYEKLPTYRIPPKVVWTKPIDLGDGTCIVKIDELVAQSNRSDTIVNICWKYYMINDKINKSRK